MDVANYSDPEGIKPLLLSLAFWVVVLYVLPLSFCPFQGCFIGAVCFLLVLDSINLGTLGRVGVLGFFLSPSLGRFSNAAACTGGLVAAVTLGAYTRAHLSCKAHGGQGLSLVYSGSYRASEMCCSLTLSWAPI